MVYYKNAEDGYILSVESSQSDNEITKAEYDNISAIIAAKPTAPSGYEYKLRESDLTWELVEIVTDTEATIEDYQSALNTLGVSTDEEVNT